MTTNPEASNPLASTGSPSTGTGKDPKEATRQEADRLKDHAQSAASDLAGTAKDEAHTVQDEAMTQAKSLGKSVQDEVGVQASTQQQRLAEQSRTVTDDLQRISRGESPQSDMVLRAVSTVADRAEAFTRHLETKEPADLLDDVRRFASRRPGTFLLLAAGAGLLAGRLTRGLRDAGSDDDSTPQHRGTTDRNLPRPPATQPVRGTETLGVQPGVEHPRTDLGGRL